MADERGGTAIGDPDQASGFASRANCAKYVRIYKMIVRVGRVPRIVSQLFERCEFHDNIKKISSHEISVKCDSFSRGNASLAILIFN